jgi:beta propeller repeat protein
MKTNKKLYSVAIASAALILFLILVSSAASAATVGYSSLSVDETRITTSGGVISRDIYNDKIVWSTLSGDLYMYDLSTNKETHITTSVPVYTCSIYGNKIFWESWDKGDIYVYNISTKKETRLNTSGPSFGGYSVYGNKLVRADASYDDGDIYLYDLSTNKETKLTGNESNQYSPVIYGDRIVWSDVRDGKHDLYMYNISTQKEIRITNSGAADGHSMYGDRIVWEDSRNEKSNIYMYDISTKKETRITTIGPSYSPGIYGDRIVYEDERDIYGGGRLYLYNISTGQEFHITKGSGFPSIYGDRILWVDNRNDNDGDVYVGTISEREPTLIPPIANFSAIPISGKAPLSVFFSDKSTGTSKKWKWDFGDGTTSTKQNPTHKYSKAGNYTVALTVTNAAGSNTVTKADYIKVVTKPVAAFSASPTSGKVPLNVKFTDASTGTPTKWKWNFGDGTTSVQQNPIHKYSKAGKYTVTLTVTNAAGSNTVTKSNYITMAAKPVAAFSASPTSGKYPLNVKFTDKSTGSPTKWKWDFGDGTISTKQNPTHKYSAAGKYTVTLTVTNAAGINTVTKSNYITVTGTSQAPTADFWGWPLSGKAPLKVKFTETSKGSPTSWKWDFGDGKYSTEKSPTHTYSSAGTYTVKLIATNEAGSSTKLKWKYIKVAK